MTKPKFEGNTANWVTGVAVEGLLLRTWKGDSPNSAVLPGDNVTIIRAAINELRAFYVPGALPPMILNLIR